MATTAMRTICLAGQFCVRVTPVARPRPAFGAAWNGVPGPSTPIRWNESFTLCGFHEY